MPSKFELAELQKISIESPEEIATFFANWNSLNETSKVFSEVDNLMREEIVKIFLNNSENANVSCRIIETIRLISRDKTNVENLNTPEVCDIVLNYAGLPPKEGFQNSIKAIFESLKCLINTLFNSNNMRTRFDANPENRNILLQYLIDLKEENQQNSNQQWIRNLSNENASEMWYLYHRIGFIVTALIKPVQMSWAKNPKLIKALFGTAEIVIPGQIPRTVTIQDNNRANEALKTAFNVYCHSIDSIIDEEALYYINKILKKLIVSNNVNEDVKQSAVNCFATPSIIPVVNILCKNDETLEDSNDMTFVKAILDQLDEKLNSIPQDPQTTSTTNADLLGPYFSALSRLCRDNKYARRFCRLKVLPPLKDKDVEKRPEEGNTLRSKIVRLMMLPTVAKDIAAQFLFILCKKSVPRMIKYTGFGHSAGLLANMGLLGKINESRRTSDSEDSETEEYNSVRDNVNPVTGSLYAPDRESVLEKMSEEQKEYEAMKLMDAMNKMMDAGIVKPGTIGEDGKLREVSHVLELTKNIPDEVENSDSD